MKYWKFAHLVFPRGWWEYLWSLWNGPFWRNNCRWHWRKLRFL